MNTFLIIVIVVVVLALVFGILWCIFQHAHTYTPPNLDTEQGLGDEPEEKIPVRDPRIGIRMKHPLLIREVLEKNIVIQTSTRRKHIFWGNSNQVILIFSCYQLSLKNKFQDMMGHSRSETKPI